MSKCKYEGSGVWEGRCTGTKEVDPCPGYDRCDRFKPEPSAGEVISEFQKQCERDFLLANMPKLWVSVEDRLPSTPGKYVVCTAKGSVYCAPFRIFKTGDTAKGYFGADQYTIITHWMPLPAAPAKEET